jgi:hypothetical protein
MPVKRGRGSWGAFADSLQTILSFIKQVGVVGALLELPNQVGGFDSLLLRWFDYTTAHPHTSYSTPSGVRLYPTLPPTSPYSHPYISLPTSATSPCPHPQPPPTSPYPPPQPPPTYTPLTPPYSPHSISLPTPTTSSLSLFVHSTTSSYPWHAIPTWHAIPQMYSQENCPFHTQQVSHPHGCVWYFEL